MYALKEICRTENYTETIITAEMIPMKERIYVNADGIYIIEYYMDDSDLK